MANDLRLAALRPLIIAIAMFTVIAGAAFAWASVENQRLSAHSGESKIVALPN